MAAHRPDPEEPGWCICGAQEVYFEPYADDPFGYGCERLGRPTEAFRPKDRRS